MLALAAIAIFIWGYNFLKGKDIFEAQRLIYVEYERIDGLDKAASVLINGFPVGIVSDVYLKEDGSGKIMVVINLDPGVNVPKSTVATIVSTDPLSGKVITLDYEGACSEGNCAVPGDTLTGNVKGLIESMMGDGDYVEKAKEAINAGIDSLMVKIGQGGAGDFADAMGDLQSTLKNLNSVTYRLDRLLAESSDDLAATLENVKELTGNLRDNNQKIQNILDNAEQFSAKMNELELKETTDKANAAIDDLKSTMEKADEAIAGVKVLLDKLNYGEGTAALMLNDPKLFDNLNNAVRDLDFLLKDFRLNPKRYVNVSVFGKKQKEYKGVDNDPEGKESGENPNKKDITQDTGQE